MTETAPQVKSNALCGRALRLTHAAALWRALGAALAAGSGGNPRFIRW